VLPEPTATPTRPPQSLLKDTTFQTDASCFASLTQPGDANDVPAGLNPVGLHDNGGPTPTIGLVLSSPAVDGVPLDACHDATGIVITDQRGVARPQGAACDIGALELVVYSTVLTPAGVTPASIVAGSPGP
jgi:hypothetical protein